MLDSSWNCSALFIRETHSSTLSPHPAVTLLSSSLLGEEFGVESSASTWLTALLLQEQKGNSHSSLSLCFELELLIRSFWGAFPHHPSHKISELSLRPLPSHKPPYFSTAVLCYWVPFCQSSIQYQSNMTSCHPLQGCQPHTLV